MSNTPYFPGLEAYGTYKQLKIEGTCFAKTLGLLFTLPVPCKNSLYEAIKSGGIDCNLLTIETDTVYGHRRAIMNMSEELAIWVSKYHETEAPELYVKSGECLWTHSQAEGFVYLPAGSIILPMQQVWRAAVVSPGTLIHTR